MKKKRVCPECERILGKGESRHGNSGYLIQAPIEKALKTVVFSELKYVYKYMCRLLWVQLATLP